MRITIDAAGRLVVPKALRDAMGLQGGRAVDLTVHDGKLEIEIAPADVVVDTSGELPVIRAAGELPPLRDDEVRAAVEATRR